MTRVVAHAIGAMVVAVLVWGVTELVLYAVGVRGAAPAVASVVLAMAAFVIVARRG